MTSSRSTLLLVPAPAQASRRYLRAAVLLSLLAATPAAGAPLPLPPYDTGLPGAPEPLPAEAGAFSLGGGRPKSGDEHQPGAKGSATLPENYLQTPRTLAPGPVLVPRRGGGYEADAPGFGATILPDGSLDFDDRVTISITDWALRSAGEDPYSVEKRRFAEATEDLRARLAEDARRERLAPALGRLRTKLWRLWAAPERSPAARRAALAELWLDCDQGASGAAARALIEDFVSTELPLGCPLAFTTEELAAISARSPRLPFPPYGPPATAPAPDAAPAPGPGPGPGRGRGRGPGPGRGPSLATQTGPIHC